MVKIASKNSEGNSKEKLQIEILDKYSNAPYLSKKTTIFVDYRKHWF